MKKADKHLQNLLKSWDSSPVPEVILTKNKEEHFFVAREKKQIKIVSSNARIASFALQQVKLGIDSKVNYYPQISIRPLFFYGTHLYQLSASISVVLPDLLNEQWKEQLHLLCQRAIGFGYNALIFGYKEGFQSDISAPSIEQEYFDIIKEYDLKIIIQPFFQTCPDCTRCPLDLALKQFYEHNFSEIKKKYPKIDDLYFRSNYLNKDFLNHPQAGKWTYKELILEEIKTLAKCANRKLLYYVPASESLQAEKVSEWMMDLLVEIPKNVWIVFSAKRGDPFLDHLPSHPFWSKVYTLAWGAKLPVLPMINIGGILQGEGLWTLHNTDLIEHYVGKAIQFQMEGVITLANTLPSPESFLGLSLWLNSRMMWNPKEKSAWLQERWHQMYHKDWCFEHYLLSLTTVRQLSLKLSLLRTLILEPLQEIYTQEDYRLIAETLYHRLNELHHFNEKNKSSLVKDSIFYFVRDAKNILSYFLQAFNISLLGMQNDKEVHEAFWTSIQTGGAGKKIILLEKPLLTSNEKMRKIYFVNRLYS